MVSMTWVSGCCCGGEGGGSGAVEGKIEGGIKVGVALAKMLSSVDGEVSSTVEKGSLLSKEMMMGWFRVKVECLVLISRVKKEKMNSRF